MPFKGPKIKILLVALVLHLNQSCSMQGLLLTHGDTVMLWFLEDMLTLEGDQEKEVQKHIDQIWLDFTCKGVPIAVAEIERLLAIYKTRGLTPSLALDIESKSQFYRAEVMRYLTPSAKKLLPMLNKKQIDELASSLKESREKDKKFVEADAEDFWEEFSEKAIENFETWYGSLTKIQEEKLLAIIGRDQTQQKAFFQLRVEGHRNFIAWLKSNPSQDDIGLYLKKVGEDPASLRPAPMQKTYKERNKLFYQRIISIDELADKRQREHLISKFEKIRQDLHEVQNCTIKK